jgi:hypothetical protein
MTARRTTYFGNDCYELSDNNNKRRTHMQTFHRANRTATLDGLVDLFIERLPVVEWFDAEKLEKGVEFFNAILPDVW